MAGAEAAAPASTSVGSERRRGHCRGIFDRGAGRTAGPAGDASIRPFRFHASDEALADLKRRITATNWPEREIDPTQGVGSRRCRSSPIIGRTVTTGARSRRRLNALPQFITEIDGRRHPLHPRPLEASECAAGDHHPRLAGLDHRAAEDHRPADRSDRAWRQRGGRVRRRHPVAAGLRLLGQADRDRLGPVRASRAPGPC